MEPDVTCRTSSTSVAVPCRLSARVNASSAYLAVADELGAGTIAFPLVSAGIYHWPNDDAVRHALTVLTSAETTVGEPTASIPFGSRSNAPVRPDFFVKRIDSTSQVSRSPGPAGRMR